MGYFGHWIVVRGARRSAFRRLGLEAASTEAAPGWRYGFGSDLPDDLEELVRRAAEAGDGAAIGAWVFDSDYGHVLAIDGDRRAAVAIRAELAEDHLDHDPEELARWSSCAPGALTAAAVQAIVARDDVFAEETVDELLDSLGLPAPYDPLETPTVQAPIAFRIGKAVKTPKRRQPTLASIAASELGGYLQPLGYMAEETYVGRKAISWRELRYVPGLGDGFIGIWDREAPEAPVSRFAISRRGDARLMEELERLQTPLKVLLLGAKGLGGFVAPLEIMGAEVRIAERDLRLASSRFVPGRGADFVGIWDRTRPEEPIERFRPGDAGELSAYQRVPELLFEELLAAKVTAGTRQYRPPGPPAIVKHEPMKPPKGMSREQRQVWEEMGASYSQLGGYGWLVVAEEPDDDWQVVMDIEGKGSFYSYILDAFGPIACRGRFSMLDDAKAYVAQQEGNDVEWQDVPSHVPPTLLATLRWAERERHGSSGGPWYERFDWVEPATTLGGTLWGARVVGDGVPVGAVLVAEHGPEDEAAAYLIRRGDGPRLIYSLDDFEALAALLENYLGAVQLEDWFSLTEEWPRDLASLLEPMLLVTGPAD